MSDDEPFEFEESDRPATEGGLILDLDGFVQLGAIRVRNPLRGTGGALLLGLGCLFLRPVRCE